MKCTHQSFDGNQPFLLAEHRGKALVCQGKYGHRILSPSRISGCHNVAKIVELGLAEEMEQVFPDVAQNS